jgi:hypothetical protein
MNCDCKKSIEARLLDRLKTEHPEGQNHSATLDGYGFGITEDNKMVLQGCTPISLQLMVPKKDSGLKPKKINQSMVWTFCPFCGAKAN